MCSHLHSVYVPSPVEEPFLSIFCLANALELVQLPCEVMPKECLERGDEGSINLPAKAKQFCFNNLDLFGTKLAYTISCKLRPSLEHNIHSCNFSCSLILCLQAVDRFFQDPQKIITNTSFNMNTTSLVRSLNLF